MALASTSAKLTPAASPARFRRAAVSVRASAERPANCARWTCGGLCLLLVLMLALPQMRRIVLGAGLAAAVVSVPLVREARSAIFAPLEVTQRQGEVKYTEAEWKELLGDAAYRVLRQEATERPWSSPLNDEKRAGTFACAGCGTPLFPSSAKYNSGTGWPSFYDVLPGAVDEVADLSIVFLPRTEIRCHRCQGHLGHVFEDGPAPTGLRYCMNGLALKFVPEGSSGAA